MDPHYYQDLAGEHDLFSPYPSKILRGIDGPRVYAVLGPLFKAYAPHASPLKMGNDSFLLID